MEHARVNVGEVSLHVVSEGAGAPVVLLHGFPEFWYSWRKQLPALAAAGFRAVAPDLRGYNESDRPLGVHNYTLDKLTADVANLCRSLAPRVSLVGHDWGGVIAWSVAHHHPELVDKLVVMNAPHPGRLLHVLRSPRQLLRFWYAFFFQLPWLPENRIHSSWFLPRALRGLSRNKAAFSDEDLARYREALHRDGAATAAINYYRAVPRSWPRIPGRVTAPTMVVWGERDSVLGTELLDGLDERVDKLRIELLPASHWVQHDEPERVNELLVEFLRGER
jgi:pimeloyl-ACP methyl ester carboxylesterase